LIRRYCVRSGLQAADTEDVCQLVLLAMTHALPSFRFDPARGRFRNYLGRIIRSAIYQQRACPRGAPRSLEGSMQELLIASNDDSVDQAWEQEWVRHHLRRAMSAVRTQCKPESLDVFERLLGGESIEGVAAACGLTTEAVHKIKQRIGQRLRVEVERQVRDEELPDVPS
jgi:RNA polymerase sigma factor (sigma-70 family)